MPKINTYFFPGSSPRITSPLLKTEKSFESQQLCMLSTWCRGVNVPLCISAASGAGIMRLVDLCCSSSSSSSSSVDLVDLVELCREGDLEGVRAALQGGVDVNTKDENGWTGLMLAILFNHNSVVEILLSKPDIDVNWKANDGFCALSWAVFKQNNEALKMLTNFPNIDVNVVVHGETIVYRALIHQNIEGLRILLSHPDIDVNIVVNGETLVYRALRHQKSLKMVRHQKELKILRH